MPECTAPSGFCQTCQQLRSSGVSFRWCAPLHALQRRETLRLIADVPRICPRAVTYLQQLANHQSTQALRADGLALNIYDKAVKHFFGRTS